MRIVLDTNTVLSGLLWGGMPYLLLDLGMAGNIDLFTSRALLNELSNALRKDKFTALIASRGTTPIDLMQDYRETAESVIPIPIERTVRDPDDDVVIGTALAAQADMIVSGDKDLLVLHPHQGILIFNARAALQHVEAHLGEQSKSIRKDIHEDWVQIDYWGTETTPLWARAAL